MSQERGEIFDELRVMVEAGTVKPAVGKVFPLSEALDAVDHVYSRRSVGKTVVAI